MKLFEDAIENRGLARVREVLASWQATRTGRSILWAIFNNKDVREYTGD